MIVAIPTEGEEIFQHFGHTQCFTLFEVEDHWVKNTTKIGAWASGDGALAVRLKEAGANVLICGGIGPGAVQALGENGIEVIAGVTGKVQDAIAAYLSGKKLGSPNANCDHHHEGGHSCHGHTCHH